MKSILLIASLMFCTTLFAAKEPLTFAPGLRGYLGKYTQAQIDSMITLDTNSGVTVVTIYGTTSKDTLQLTEMSETYKFSLKIKSQIKAK